MKKIIMAVLFCLVSLKAWGHPPQDINLSLKDKRLYVSVVHGVKNPKDHYIKEIEVSLNGKEYQKKMYNYQIDNKEQRAVFYLAPLKSGDTITVEADCNKSGTKNKDLEVSAINDEGAGEIQEGFTTAAEVSIETGAGYANEDAGEEVEEDSSIMEDTGDDEGMMEEPGKDDTMMMEEPAKDDTMMKEPGKDDTMMMKEPAKDDTMMMEETDKEDN